MCVCATFVVEFPKENSVSGAISQSCTATQPLHNTSWIIEVVVTGSSSRTERFQEFWGDGICLSCFGWKTCEGVFCSKSSLSLSLSRHSSSKTLQAVLQIRKKLGIGGWSLERARDIGFDGASDALRIRVHSDRLGLRVQSRSRRRSTSIAFWFVLVFQGVSDTIAPRAAKRLGTGGRVIFPARGCKTGRDGAFQPHSLSQKAFYHAFYRGRGGIAEIV